MLLEPRMMYDGAAVATAADVHHDGATDAGHPGSGPSDAANASPPPVAPPTNTGTDSNHTPSSDASATGASAPPTPQEVVFIDPNTPDLQELVNSVKPNDKIVFLDSGSDGLQQIADYLKENNLQDLSAIQIISHGQSGEVRLGSTVLTDANLADHADALATIGQSLAPGGDILIYGCDVAQGAGGSQFITDLSHATGANVAASTHDIGLTSQGENWNLDASTGPIEATLPFTSAIDNYQGLLTNTTLTTSQSYTLSVDADGDGQVDPGDTITIDVTINNTGTADATNVSLSEALTELAANNPNTRITPIAFDDNYSGIVGNTPITFNALGGVLANDIDPDASTPFSNTGLTVDNIDTTGLHGTVLMNANGSFTFTPETGFAGTTSFTYHALDAQNLDSVSTGKVTFTVTDPVWYVDATAASGGDGSFGHAFQTIGAAATAAHNNANDANGAVNDTIFVANHSDATPTTYSESAGITLDNGEKLLGDGSSLTSVNGNPVGDKATNPIDQVTGNNATAVTLGSGNTISGIDITTTGTLAAGIKGTDFGTLTVTNVTLHTTGTALDLTNGAFASGASFNSTTVTTAGITDISLNNVTGTVDLGGGALNGEFLVTAGTVSTTYGGSITESANAPMVDVTGGHNGTLTFNGTLNATNGTGLQFDNADGHYNFNGTTTLHGGGDAGIDIVNGSDGFFTFGSNTSIIDPSGVAFNVNGGIHDIDYKGTISKTNDGQAIAVTGHTGGMVSFESTVSSTSLSDGINLTGNTGAVLAFSGVLTLDTSASGTTAFNASGGGTVTATASGSTINSGAGTGLNVVSTNIGVAGLKFQSISANGATNGIVLNSTGASGGLTVTGVGTTAGSGGTIQNTDQGALFTSTSNLSLSNMNFTNADKGNGTAVNLFTSGFNSAAKAAINMSNVSTATFTNLDLEGTDSSAGGAQAGINGQNVSNLTIANSKVIGFGDTDGGNNAEGDVLLWDLSGTSSISNSTFGFLTSGGNTGENLVDIRNDTGTLTLNISGSTFQNTRGSLNGSDGLQVNSLSSATINLNVTHSSFLNLQTGGIDAFARDSSTMNVNIISSDGTTANGNTFDSQGGVGRAIGLNAEDTAHLNFNINRNASMKGFGGPILEIHSIDTGNIQGHIDNNADIENNGTTNRAGSPVYFNIEDSSVAVVEMSGNTVNDAGQDSAIAVNLQGDGTSHFNASLDLTLTGNTINLTGQNLNANTFNNGILLSVGAATSDATTLTVNLQNNAVTGANATNGNAGLAIENTGGVGSHLYMEGFNTDPATTWNNRGNTPTTGTYANAVAELDNGTAPAPSAIPAGHNGGTTKLPTNSNALILDPTGGVEAAAPSGTGTTPADPGTPDQSATGTQDQSANSTPDQTVTTPPDQTATDNTNVNDGVLTQAELDAIVAAAIQRWDATGLTAAQMAYLENVSFSIADLTGFSLGAASSGHVSIDANAAGHGWFIDPTPLSDSEFGNDVGGALYTTPSQAPAGHVDLLTTVMHELGHELGLSDTYSLGDQSSLMYGFILDGERRLPVAGEADGGVLGAIVGQDFALGTVDIGKLPAGKSVEVFFDATANSQTDALIQDGLSQGTVSGGNFTTVTTNNLDTPIDSLTLGDRIFVDANNNGAYDAGEGVNGVTLTLYADNGTTPGQFDSGDTLVATTTTATVAGQAGAYSFTGLAPGDYIVRVDQTNFDSGHALNNGTAGANPISGAVDPDNNVDNDSNGAVYAGPGGGVVSLPITLDYNSETTADGTGHNDINDTLDFGFIYDQPPTVPTDNDATANSVIEGASAGSTVGITAFSTDPDGPTIAYSITSDSSGGGFQIDAATGVVTVADPSKINYEQGTHQYTITVAATDNQSVSTTANFTIGVTDANPSTPTDGNGAANTVVEGASAGTTVGVTAASTDVNGPAVSYSITNDTSGGGFQIDAVTGVVTVADGSKIDYESTAPGHSYDITVQASDGQGGTSTQTFAIGVTDAAPIAIGEHYTINEDTTLAVPVATGVLTNDSDVNGGALTAVLDSGPAHAASFTLNADGTFSYTPSANFNGSDSFTYHASDGTLPSNTATVGITILAVNDPPVPATPAAHYSAIEQTAISLKNTGLSVSDVDDLGGTETATLSVTEGTLNVTAGGSGAIVSGSGTSSVTISGTLVQINGLLNTDGTSAVSYIDNLDNPSTSATLTLSVNDNGHTGLGGPQIGTGAATIDITPVNDAPVVANPSASVAYTENGSPVTLSSGFTVSDVDSTSLSGARVVLSGGFSGDGDILSANTSGTLISASYDATTHTLTLTGNDTLANYQHVLQSVSYSSTSDNPTNYGGNLSRTATFSVTDLDAHPNPAPNNLTTTAAVQTTVDITAVNDAPQVTAGNTIHYNADDSHPVVLDHNITVQDPDNTTLTGATVRIASGRDGFRDELSFTNQNGITGSYDATAGTLTLTGNATVAEYQVALASVTFQSESAKSGTRTIAWQVNDGSASNNLSAVSSTTVDVRGASIRDVDHDHDHDRRGDDGDRFGEGHHELGPTPILDLFGDHGHFDPGHTPAIYFVHAKVTNGDITGAIGPDRGHFLLAQVPLAELVAPLSGGYSAAIFATVANGDPLPDWLHFDPATGVFSGEVPDGAVGTLTLQVIARDIVGHETVLEFSIDLVTGKVVWSGPNGTEFAHDSNGSEGAARHATADPDRGLGSKLAERLGWQVHTGRADAMPAATEAPTVLPGRIGLTQQLRSAGSHAIHAQRIALLESLRHQPIARH